MWPRKEIAQLDTWFRLKFAQRRLDRVSIQHQTKQVDGVWLPGNWAGLYPEQLREDSPKKEEPEPRIERRRKVCADSKWTDLGRVERKARWAEKKKNIRTSELQGKQKAQNEIKKRDGKMKR